MTRNWSNDVVAPLRRARRTLKEPPPQAHTGIAPMLRERIKKIELAAEKVEQGMLESLARDILAPTADRSGSIVRARGSLTAYGRTAGAGYSQAVADSLIEELIGLTISASNPDGHTRRGKN